MPPIKPSQVKKETAIPEHVFNVFNDLITEKFDGRQARFTQPEVVDALIPVIMERENVNEIEAKILIFDRHWLDIESAYRKVGWEVNFDKSLPLAGENYDSYWVFKKKS